MLTYNQFSPVPTDGREARAARAGSSRYGRLAARPTIAPFIDRGGGIRVGTLVTESWLLIALLFALLSDDEGRGRAIFPLFAYERDGGRGKV